MTKEKIKKPNIDQRLKALEDFAEKAAVFINVHHQYIDKQVQKETQVLKELGVLVDKKLEENKPNSSQDIVSDGATA